MLWYGACYLCASEEYVAGRQQSVDLIAGKSLSGHSRFQHRLDLCIVRCAHSVCQNKHDLGVFDKQKGKESITPLKMQLLVAAYTHHIHIFGDLVHGTLAVTNLAGSGMHLRVQVTKSCSD